jgi:biotin carboxyl carrier protein
MARRLAVALALALALPAPTALAADGGAPAPSGSGGAEVGAPVDPAATAPRTPRRGWPRRPVAKFFGVTPKPVAGAPIDFTYRIDARALAVRARIEIVPAGARKPVAKLNLGSQPTRSLRTYRFTPAPGAPLVAGTYMVRLHAVDPRGRVLARRTSASGRTTLTITAPATSATGTVPGIFPVAGPHNFGGPDARFGAARAGHIHQGQDVLADEGTPVLAPVAGTVLHRDYQDKGAGYYVEMKGDDGRDYFLCHFVAGSTVVAEGQRVAAGQQLAAVGHTGDATGPHLHFEIWVGGWHVAGSSPIDPLPDLTRWEAGPS